MTSNNTQPTAPNTPEEPVRVNHTTRNIVIAVVVVVAIVLAIVFGMRAVNKNDDSPKGSKNNPVVIGVVGATDPQWMEFTKQAEQQGVYVQIKDFQDYTSENPALAQGDLDMNEFQHLLYLANYNVQNKQNLQPLGGVAIYPLGVYSAFDKDGKPRYTDITPAGWLHRRHSERRDEPGSCNRRAQGRRRRHAERRLDGVHDPAGHR